MKKQMAFYFDQSRCSGCYTCAVACKDWHDVPAGPAKWLRIETLEKGKYPEVSVSFMFNTCFHCANPECIAACPVGAFTKREEDGIVIVNKALCLGKDSCQLCLEACPYGAPQFGAEDNARIQKCDFCLERLAENKPPICVAGCPMRALDAGPLDELKKKKGSMREADGFTHYDTGPSIIFTPSRFYQAIK